MARYSTTRPADFNPYIFWLMNLLVGSSPQQAAQNMVQPLAFGPLAGLAGVLDRSALDIARRIPRRVVRYASAEAGERAATVADVAKPQGLYTSPAKGVSPHRELGGPRTTFRTKRSANTLTVDATDFIESNRGPVVGQPAGIAAFRKLAGDTQTRAFLRLPRADAIRQLERQFPELVGTDWRYYDTHALGEVYGAQLARRRGYDAIWAIDRTLPEFSEYVALTKSALKSRGR